MRRARISGLVEAGAENARSEGGPVPAVLLAGAVALGLLMLVLTKRALGDAGRLLSVLQPRSLALTTGAAAALIVGWLRPAPWLLMRLLVAILSTLWFFAMSRFLRAGARGEP